MMRHQKITPVIAARMAQMYQSGASLREIAEAVGCSETTANTWVKRQGVEMRRGPRPLDPARWDRAYTPEELAQIRLAYLSGRTMSELGREWGCTEGAIRYHLLKMGVAPRPRRTLSPRRASYCGDVIRAARIRLGLSQQALARELGIENADAIRQWERGTRLPNATSLLRLMYALKLRPSDFLKKGGGS